MIIDKEFHALIPPLSKDEHAQLEANIKEDGCRDPLVIWAGHETILDGHNRYEICTRLGIPFHIVKVELPDRDAALNWIDTNQLGRRNLSPDQMSLIRGRLYNRMKKPVGKPTGTILGQNDPISTAEVVADLFGVSPATVKRDGTMAEYLAKNPDEGAAVLKGKMKLSDVRRNQKRVAVIKQLENISTKKNKEVEGLYDVIVIDPPWEMKKIDRDERPNQTEFDYPTMTEEELSILKIPACDDCHVWLWTTHKHLPMAFTLLTNWGMKYVCTFVWHKPGGFQPIGLPQYNSEFALYARKGTPAFIDTKNFPVCFTAPRQGHSVKPEEFYDTVRRVTAGRRLDMFSRRKIDGFDGWGLEAE